MKHLFSIFFWCAFFIINTVHAEDPIPELKGRVNDYAGVLSTREEQELSNRLQLLETETGAQVVILTVKTTSFEEIEEFSIRVLDEWKLGQKNIDNGVLLLAAVNDRKFRIDVGYGLEGYLTDGYCKLLIVNTIAPSFKRGFYYDGFVLVITDFYSKLLSLGKEETVDFSEAEDGIATYKEEKENRKKGELIATIIVVSIMVLPFARLIKSKKIKLVILGGFVLLVFVLTLSFIISGIILLLSFVALFATNVNGITRNGRGGFGGGMGGSGFGGGFGGGGFSGGGGGFGGGGASGGW